MTPSLLHGIGLFMSMLRAIKGVFVLSMPRFGRKAASARLIMGMSQWLRPRLEKGVMCLLRRLKRHVREKSVSYTLYTDWFGVTMSGSGSVVIVSAES